MVKLLITFSNYENKSKTKPKPGHLREFRAKKRTYSDPNIGQGQQASRTNVGHSCCAEPFHVLKTICIGALLSVLLFVSKIIVIILQEVTFLGGGGGGGGGGGNILLDWITKTV